ncbi:transcription elongation factor GreA [Dietzia sp.]|uniref:transcription elongation factor GreA n=1 Tax=Dietzia sp. TaxID=1871616 RepID=UPI002FDA6418
MTEGQTWLTQESYDKLKAEKDALIANRPVIAAEINERREEGDLKENGGYHAARDQQGQEESRIRQLEELLANAVIGEAPTESGVALVGSVVRVYLDGDEDDKLTFLIATREESSSKSDLETFSPDSPIGKAVLGAKEGETVEYPAPNGSSIKVTIVTADPYKG